MNWCVRGLVSGASFVIGQSAVCNFLRGEQSRQRQLYQGGAVTAWESESREFQRIGKPASFLFSSFLISQELAKQIGY